jgi:quercetin dioxygenase-like cupin family protein
LLHRVAFAEEPMKRLMVSLMSGLALVCSSAVAGEMANVHRVFAPQDIKWRPGPPVLPAGAESAPLYGDPQKEGLFALRIKVPKGYRVAPHTHPHQELVTVISGRFGLGFGEIIDPAKTQALPAGSFASIAPGVAHYVVADEDSVYQVNALGPWEINYVDLKDDPRLNGAPDPKSKFLTSRKQSFEPM